MPQLSRRLQEPTSVATTKPAPSGRQPVRPMSLKDTDGPTAVMPQVRNRSEAVKPVLMTADQRDAADPNSAPPVVRITMKPMNASTKNGTSGGRARSAAARWGAPAHEGDANPQQAVHRPLEAARGPARHADTVPPQDAEQHGRHHKTQRQFRQAAGTGRERPCQNSSESSETDGESDAQRGVAQRDPARS